jgi:ketosteroid isomerase-like protein
MTPILLALVLQITPVAPIVKGTALPPPVTEEAGPLAVVNALFAGIAARDATAIAATMRADAVATIATENPDGSRTIAHRTREQLLGAFKPGPERFEERLYDPAIEIDGDIAMIWGRYDFLIDGKLHHCGYDHVGLVRERGSWKIQTLAWSSRTTGCDSPA